MSKRSDLELWMVYDNLLPLQDLLATRENQARGYRYAYGGWKPLSRRRVITPRVVYLYIYNLFKRTLASSVDVLFLSSKAYDPKSTNM